MWIQRLNALTLIVALSLLSACGGDSGPSSAAKEADSNYLPDNAIFVMSASVEGLFESSMFKKLQADNPEIEQGLSEAKNEIGFDPRDLARVTVAMMSTKETDVVAIIHTKRDVSIEDVKKMKDMDKMEFVPGKAGDKDVFTVKGMPVTIHFADPRTVVAGESTAINAILTRSAPTPSENMKSILANADFSKTLTVSMSFATIGEEAKKGMAENAPGPAKMILGPLVNAKSMSLTADATDVVNLAIEADFDQAANAKSLGDMIDGFKAMAMASEDAPQEAKDMMNKIVSEVDGTKLRVTASIDPSAVMKLNAMDRGPSIDDQPSPKFKDASSN